jgi:HEPN domain-containing protein
MPAPDDLEVIARGWVVKAEHDLQNATHTLRLGLRCPTDTVCFHAQQVAEIRATKQLPLPV